MSYVDSSALVAIYVPEHFSNIARKAIRSSAQIPFTQLHEIEVTNAFELLVGRHAISRDQCAEIQTQLADDLQTQRLIRLSLDLERVFTHAAELSRRYSARFLTRSLDLLHVATAHAAACTLFISADDRQLAVAKASGLAILDIKRRSSRRKAQ